MYIYPYIYERYAELPCHRGSTPVTFSKMVFSSAVHSYRIIILTQLCVSSEPLRAVLNLDVILKLIMDYTRIGIP